RSRKGRHVAKATKARAIQPRPATMPSTHRGVYTRDMKAPAKPQHMPPNSTAARRMRRTLYPSECAELGDSPTARTMRPARVRPKNHAIPKHSSKVAYTTG